MDGRCETCRFYVQPASWQEDKTFGMCRRIKSRPMRDDMKSPYVTPDAFVDEWDDSRLIAVTPDFGCVLWEPKAEDA